jgi:hypothetical protein
MPRWATALNFVIPTGEDPDFLDRKSGLAQGRDLQFHSDRTQMLTTIVKNPPDSFLRLTRFHTINGLPAQQARYIR